MFSEEACDRADEARDRQKDDQIQERARREKSATGAWTTDIHGTPRAPTAKPPYTARCEEKCGSCKDRPCSKANGHEWSCNCHYEACWKNGMAVRR